MGRVIGSKSPLYDNSFDGMIISRATKLRAAGCVEPQSSNFVRGLPFPAAVAAALSACRPSGCRGFFFFFSPSPKDARRFSKRPAEPPPRLCLFSPPAIAPARRRLFRPRPFLAPGLLLAPALARSLRLALVFAPLRQARAHDPGDALVVGRVVPVVPGKHAEHLLLRSLPFRAFIVGVVIVVVVVGVGNPTGRRSSSFSNPSRRHRRRRRRRRLPSPRAPRVFSSRGARPSRRCARRRSPP